MTPPELHVGEVLTRPSSVEPGGNAVGTTDPERTEELGGRANIGAVGTSPAPPGAASSPGWGPLTGQLVYDFTSGQLRSYYREPCREDWELVKVDEDGCRYERALPRQGELER